MSSSQRKLIVVFGLPAAGKTYVSTILQNHFDYFFYDGDNDVTVEMKKAIEEKIAFTEEMRDIFFNRLIESVLTLSLKHEKLVVSQTFIKEKYRKQLFSQFPSATFILVKTSDAIREKRLIERTEYPLDLQYSQQMVTNFDEPTIPHEVILNQEDGEEGIIQQLKMILPTQSIGVSVIPVKTGIS